MGENINTNQQTEKKLKSKSIILYVDSLYNKLR
jgi:hypothetical protein